MMHIDFGALQDEIEQAARQALEDMLARHPDEEVCAFALYSDSGAMTVCPATNTRSHLSQAQREYPKEATFYRFSPTEWHFEGDGAEKAIELICTRVREEVMRQEDEDEDEARFDDFKSQLFETCILALESLRRDGVFDRFGPDFLVMFSVSDEDVPPDVALARVVRLNGPGVVAEFEAWTKTWVTD